MAIITIFDSAFKIAEADYNFNYQTDLTARLDNQFANVDQNLINETILWKVNRYAFLDNETLRLLNDLDQNTTLLDEEITRKILFRLLSTKGIRLPMASTILRFRNKNCYQIIDQRLYRIIYKNPKLKLAQHLKADLATQIKFYLKYLIELTKACKKLNIPFANSDRILYKVDKRINRDYKLSG